MTTKLPKYVSDRIDLEDIFDKLAAMCINGRFLDKEEIIKCVISKAHHYDKTKNANPGTFFATIIKNQIIVSLRRDKELIKEKLIQEEIEKRNDKIKQLFD